MASGIIILQLKQTTKGFKMKQLGVLSLISLLLIGCQSGQPQVPTYPGYALVFADEFDGTRLNTANWSYREGDGCPDIVADHFQAQAGFQVWPHRSEY
jgi:hypothetical protein